MSEQISLLGKALRSDNLKKKKASVKRKWEYAFQKWSNENGFGATCESWGCCGFGSMCDWCEDNSYGRPCVRALNAMCREKGIKIDYTKRDFEKIWNGKFNVQNHTDETINAVEIYEKALSELEHNKITLGEFEERIEPLKHMYYNNMSDFCPNYGSNNSPK